MKLIFTLVTFGVLVYFSEGKPSTRKVELVEGDMLLTEDQVQLYNEVKNGRVRRAAVKGKTYLWPKGEVIYTFHTHIDPSSKDMVNKAIKHWEKKTCLKFKKRNKEKYYIKFRNLENLYGEGICQSYVGYRQKPGQEVTVGTKRSPCPFGSVVHEIGHAIGFYHEHTRPDSKDYIEVKKKNIMPGASLINWKLLSNDEVDSRGFKYDFDSIMHYGRYDGGKNLKDAVIVPLRKYANVEFGRRSELSKGDIAQVKKMYECNAQGDSELESDPSLDNEPGSGESKKNGPILQ